MADPKDIAKWMADELQRDQVLYQVQVISYLQDTGNDEFMYANQNGNLAVDKRVLNEFRKLTEGSVVWMRGERAWRKREDYDDPGRRQAY